MKKFYWHNKAFLVLQKSYTPEIEYINVTNLHSLDSEPSNYETLWYEIFFISLLFNFSQTQIID
jgi:hypothetical protein